jgi:ABC-2 type transport system permease protein
VSHAIRAEWTKLRTSPGTLWLLVGIVAATIGLGRLTDGLTGCRTDVCGFDPAKVSLSGVQLGQAVVAILAAVFAGNEYATGMIRVTLAAVPRRWTVLAAKALVVTGVVLAAAAAGVLGSALGLPVTGGNVRAAAGSVLYLVLVGLLTLGITVAVRNSAAAVGIVLGLAYVFPIVAAVVRDKHLREHLDQVAPLTAGLAVQATKRLGELPISPWKGLGVLALWAAAALLAGGVVLARSDAR